MALTKPFYRHTQTVTGLMAPAPEPERYPYHDNDECPVGQAIKESDDWQYYRDEPGSERTQCRLCAELLTRKSPQLAAPRVG